MERFRGLAGESGRAGIRGASEVGRWVSSSAARRNSGGEPTAFGNAAWLWGTAEAEQLFGAGDSGDAFLLFAAGDRFDRFRGAGGFEVFGRRFCRGAEGVGEREVVVLDRFRYRLGGGFGLRAFDGLWCFCAGIPVLLSE